MKKESYIKKIKRKYKESKKSSLLVYLILRTLVIICMVLQLIRGEWNNAFLCLLSLVLFTLPTFLQDRLKITIPTALETIIYLFIFSAEILGEINNFYGNIPHWDTLLHTINGFLAAGVGFSLIDLLNENSKSIKLTPVFVAVVAFCFSMTIGVLWEFFEYSADTYFFQDMQKDKIVNNISSVSLNPDKKNVPFVIKDIQRTEIVTANDTIVIDNGYLDIGIHDTMKDLFVNFIGAVIFSFIGYLYILNRDRYKFAANFIPTKNSN